MNHTQAVELLREALERIADYDSADHSQWKIAREALAATASLEAPSGEAVWLPIETAPRDCSLIMLGRAEDEENDRGAISTPGRWYEEDHDGPDNMGHDAGFMDDEFQQFAWGRSFGNSAYKNGGFQPTHWMPLPTPPASAEPAPPADLRAVIAATIGFGRAGTNRPEDDDWRLKFWLIGRELGDVGAQTPFAWIVVRDSNGEWDGGEPMMDKGEAVDYIENRCLPGWHLEPIYRAATRSAEHGEG